MDKMNAKKIVGLFFVSAVLIVTSRPIASQQPFQTLDALSHSSEVITFKFSGVPEFRAFKLTDPLRLVIDFRGAVHNLKAKETVVQDNEIFSRIRSGQFRNEPVQVTRVVVDLKRDMPYEIQQEGSDVILRFARISEDAKREPASPRVNPQVVSRPASPPAPDNRATKPRGDTPTKQERTKAGKVNIPKTRVSFDFNAADIRDVLRVLSAQSGINIIHGADVRGSVTLTLKNVPFDQALNTILNLHGLVMQDVGNNILRVMTHAVMAEERGRAVTFTKVYPLNYASAADVKAQLDSVRVAEGRPGNIIIDDASNSLIVTDSAAGFKSVERIMAEIDRRPQQVLIEARLVEVNLDRTTDLGIDWSYTQTNVSADQTTDVGASARFPALPVDGQLSRISFGIVSDSVRLTAMLSALAQRGETRLLSSPRVTTLNNQEARIHVGERVPYVRQTTQPGAPAGGVTEEVAWLDIGIKLNVTPTVNEERQITLEVFPEVSSVVGTGAGGRPIVGTREARTTVMVRDNETVVIGGLIREEDVEAISQVPLLGDIPILGALFRRQYTAKERSELLVFVTPRLLE